MDAAVKKPIRIALVEDHSATREALSAQLERFADRMTLVEAVANAEALLALGAKLEAVDVVLVDLGLPGMDGIALIRELAKSVPNMRTLALTVMENKRAVFDTIQAGAYGYLLKDEAPERLAHAIEEASRGGYPISSRVAGFLFSETRKGGERITLSAREDELAQHLASGASYSECAERMGITFGTVQQYVKRLYRKLDVKTKREVREWVSLYRRDD